MASVLFAYLFLAVTTVRLWLCQGQLPPPQDQCKSVNASEPAECPDHIGPPCPPCYTNFREDYVDGNALAFSSSQKELISEFSEFYINWWAENYPPRKTEDGYDIFTGSAGRGNIHLRLYQYSDQNQTLLTLAQEYLSHALSILPSSQQYTSYSFGFNGVYTLQAVIESILGNTNEMQQYLQRTNDLFADISVAMQTHASTSPKYGLDMTHLSLNAGLAGSLHNALLLNKYFGAEIVSVDYIRNLTFFLLDSGIATGQQRGHNYLEYLHPFLNGCYCYGAGAGSSGVVKMVYTAYNEYPAQLSAVFTDPKYYTALKNTIDHYVAIRLADGNIPTDVSGRCSAMYGSDDDARVQWCHGCPGFINVFMESAILFADYNASVAETYLNAALLCSNVTWARGLLVKGTMYCHGIGGNTYMLWELYDLLGDMQARKPAFVEYLAAAQPKLDLAFLQRQSIWRAKQFILWTLNWTNLLKTRMYLSDSSYAMHQGNFALPMLYIQAVQDGWPQTQKACKPIWNLCI